MQGDTRGGEGWITDSSNTSPAQRGRGATPWWKGRAKPTAFQEASLAVMRPHALSTTLGAVPLSRSLPLTGEVLFSVIRPPR
jgi:hypothetical protein